MEIIVIIVLLFILIFAAVPICWALGITGIVALMMVGGDPLTLIPQSIYSGINYFPLMAVPFYIFAGEIMNKGGITKQLIRLSELMIGRVQGSLAYVNVITSMFFAGISGSAQSDVSCEGSLIIPAMIEQGYSKETAFAVTVSSSLIGPIIPPSIIMIIYGSTMGVSVGAMFIGGAIPGILVGLGLMIVIFLQNKTMHFPVSDKVWTKKEVADCLMQALPPLGMPLIIVGGILSGVFTATEAGAVSCVYALIICILILKTVRVKDLWPMLVQTAAITASILIIIGCSKTVSWAMVLLNVSESLHMFFTTMVSSKFVFLLLINLLLLFVGTFMDGSAALLMLAPILAPIATGAYGINAIQFGLIMCINLVIGMATPPLGLCLFIGCKIARISVGRGGIALIPYLIAEVAVLLLVSYVPIVTLLLPGMFGIS